jgi:hypothetical protein
MWPNDSKQIRPIFQKAAKTVAKPKKAKIFISKIHATNHVLKLPNWENVTNLLQQKVAKNVTISLGY